MNESGTLEWLEKVWNKRKDAVFHKLSMLVWDSFRAHITDTVKEKCRQLNTTVPVMLGGLTFILQPLDVCLSKSFKDRLQNKWIQWISSKDKTLIKGGNLKKVDIVTIAQWVKEQQTEVSLDIIIRLSKECCISNAMDGSEDTFMYKDTDQSGFDSYDEDDIHPDIEMILNEFDELFGKLDSESEFEGFDQHVPVHL